MTKQLSRKLCFPMLQYMYSRIIQLTAARFFPLWPIESQPGLLTGHLSLGQLEKLHSINEEPFSISFPTTFESFCSRQIRIN